MTYHVVEVSLQGTEGKADLQTCCIYNLGASFFFSVSLSLSLVLFLCTDKDVWQLSPTDLSAGELWLRGSRLEKGVMETIKAPFPLGWSFLLLFSAALNKVHPSALIPFYHYYMAFMQPLSNCIFRNNFYFLFIFSPELKKTTHGVVVGINLHCGELKLHFHIQATWRYGCGLCEASGTKPSHGGRKIGIYILCLCLQGKENSANHI